MNHSITSNQSTKPASSQTAEQTAEQSAVLVEVANRGIGGAVIWANDESFAERENLISTHAPHFDPHTFGPKGKIYDGWETRRRRSQDPGECDVAIVRLGIPARVQHCVVDTTWFRGNFPPACELWGICVDEPTPAADLAALPLTAWTKLSARSSLRGDCENEITLDATELPRCTHVRLHIYPDGGVARLRVFGTPAPDPTFLSGTIDLVAAEHGGWVRDCSNMFYSHPDQVLARGVGQSMADGWENARRRQGSHDHVTLQLAAAGIPQWVELDTSYFLHNAPEHIKLYGITPTGGETLLLAAPVLPDARNRWVLEHSPEIVQLRLEVYPDGGVSRVRLWGTLSPAGLADLQQRWG